jgi:hypothetical protein
MPILEKDMVDATKIRAGGAYLLLLAVVAVAGAGCKFRDELFCCTTASVCEEAGAPTPTACQSGFVCDEAGDFGVERTCVPAGAGCVGPSDCVDPTRPSCVDRACVAGCRADDECARFAGATQCDTTSGQCEACTENGECGTAEAPVCSLDTHTCDGCTTEEHCARFPATPHCEVAAGGCVACRTGASDCTDPNAPVCDDGACRGCETDSFDECPGSGVCEEATGACVPVDHVLFVAQTGSDTTAPCVRTTPCRTLQHAVNKIGDDKRWIVLVPAGMPYKESTVTIRNKTLVVIGTGATLTPTATGAPALDVVGGSDVEIEGLTIADASGTTGYGLGCTNIAASMPKLQISRVTITRNGGSGVTATNCTLTIEQSALSNNAGGGLVTTGSAVTVQRSMFATNAGGGVSTTRGVVVVRNSIFVGNGASEGANPTEFGGAFLNLPEAGSGFEFNTLSGNLAAPGNPAGLDCNVLTGSFAVSNSIVAGSSPTQVGSECQPDYVLSNQNLSARGVDNVTGSPTFASVGHLASGSLGINAADPDASLAIDFDGDARPAGGRSDIGADEVP